MSARTHARSYLALFALVACGTDAGGSADDVDSGTPADAGPAPDGVPPDQVRFQRDVVPIFNRSCGTGTSGCHDRAMYGANANMDCRGWLTLENASLGAQFYGGANVGQPTGCADRSLHARLIEIAPWQCAANTSYAKANDLGASYILDKVKGVDLCSVDGGAMLSQKMPPADSAFTISATDIETLEAWVIAGAKDD